MLAVVEAALIMVGLMGKLAALAALAVEALEIPKTLQTVEQVPHLELQTLAAVAVALLMTELHSQEVLEFWC
jgi:hypothetical protein